MFCRISNNILWWLAAERRENDSLRREIVPVQRVVGNSARVRQRLDDSGRLRGVSEFAAAEGNSPGDQERNASGRNRLRSIKEERLVGGHAWAVSDESRVQLDQTRTVEGPQFSSGIRARFLGGNVSRRTPA